MRIRSRTAVLLAVLAAIAGFVAVDAAKDEPVVAIERPTSGPEANAQPQGQEPATPTQEAFVVPQRQGLTTSESLLFESQTWQPPPPPPPPQVKVKPEPPPPPTAPPLPYTYAGRLVHDGQLSLLIAKGDEVIAIREGQTLDGVYRVESITDKQITMVYLPLDQKQTIPVLTALAETPPAPARAPGMPSPFGSTPGGGTPRALTPAIPSASVIAPQSPAAPASPATLAWSGPQQVKLGTPFEVSLRVKSAQPLHAWPMQLRVDTERFEVVTVRPGKPAPGAPDPAFSYRMNADGSIFVGASVQQPTAAGDSEILALTLRPVKAAPSAEVSIASLNLQGAAGRPIPHAQLAAFRTTITP
jgi:hypothetical protein